MNKNTRNFLDFLGSAAFIVIVIVLYFKVSRLLAIYLTGIALIILILSYIPRLKEYFTQLKYKDLANQLKKYFFIREEEFLEKSSFTYNELHRQMYLLSKIWDNKPMILFVNNQYIYVSKNMVDEILKAFKDMDRMRDSDRKGISITLIKKYTLKNKQELEAIITRLRKKKLL